MTNEERGPNGRKICRCGCGLEVPKRARTWYSPQHMYETDWNFVRPEVGRRAAYICEHCGRDCQAASFTIRTWLNKLWESYTDEARALRKYFHDHFIRLAPGDCRRDLWQADHIIPQYYGGPDKHWNLRCLCTWCHKKETKALAAKRKREKYMTTVMAIDPSSSCVGWALGAVEASDMWVNNGGLIKPKAGLQPIERVQAIVGQLWGLLESFKPQVVVVEIPGGKSHRRVKAAAGAGLSIYGMAAGAVWSTCYLHPDVGETHGLVESNWTPGLLKRHRPGRARILWPAYAHQAKADKGQDLADAVCMLNHWWGLEKTRNIFARARG